MISAKAGIHRHAPYADSSSWQDLIQNSVYSASAEIATLKEARLRRGALWYNSVEYGLFALPANSPATRRRGDIVITGVHALIYSTEAEALRTFFKDILELSSVDAGDGWLIFALPPAELGIHPTDEDVHHELYLACDDIQATVVKLKGKGVEFSGTITDEGWGLVAWAKIPGAGKLGIYEPKHPTALPAQHRPPA